MDHQEFFLCFLPLIEHFLNTVGFYLYYIDTIMNTHNLIVMLVYPFILIFTDLPCPCHIISYIVIHLIHECILLFTSFGASFLCARVLILFIYAHICYNEKMFCHRVPIP